MSSSDRYETPSGQSRKLSPKQKAYLAYYNDPQSPTFSNALQSALRAGYSQQYAENLTASATRSSWKDAKTTFYEEILEKAEQNLKKIVDMPEERFKENAQMMKIWKDTSAFVSERIGKDTWSSRQELTDKGGRRLFNDSSKETAAIPLSKLFKVADKGQ
jgi:hypothetical protein